MWSVRTAAAWSQPTEALAAALRVDAASGLSQEEAGRRLVSVGANEPPEPEREGPFERFVEELREPLILLLISTGVLYAVWGELLDSVTIFVIIAVLVAAEVVNEWRAERSIAALADLDPHVAVVRRDGALAEIPAREVVPGDVVVLSSEQVVPADVRIRVATDLAVDESALTGESLPVTKYADATLAEDVPLAERATMAHAGTTVTSGHGEGIVVATGASTELGQIAALAGQARPPRTPLQRQMSELSRSLVVVALALSTIVPLISMALAGQSGRDALLTGLSLAFATIPEELPILLTMGLGVDGLRMARRRAIVRRLAAMETLGAVTVVLSDKTGTLTRNELSVALSVSPLPTSEFQRLAAGSTGDHTIRLHQDPLDRALLAEAEPPGRVVAEYPFDGQRRRSGAVRLFDGAHHTVVKGAVEAVLDVCDTVETEQGTAPLDDTQRHRVLERYDAMATGGLRVLGIAHTVTTVPPADRDQAERHLCFVGLAGFADQLRPEASPAVAACHNAGIGVVMITGDHAATARSVAAEVGIDGPVLTGNGLADHTDDELHRRLRGGGVVARATPADKHRLVTAMQTGGEVVAVTGDGINDTPALAAADVGVGMGASGTDAAREHADIVLADDDFATLEAGIEEGRLLAANLRKAVRFYLAAKAALISIVLLAALAGLPQPFAPIQIIVMELFMDLAASAAFVTEAAETDLMRQPPRDPRHRFLDPPMRASILTAAASLFAAVTTAYLITYFTIDTTQAPTIAFITWQAGHVLLALHLRTEHQPIHQAGLLTNRVLNAWATAVAATLAIGLSIPAARDALRLTAVSPNSLATALAAAVAATGWIEANKHRHRDRTHQPSVA